MFDSIDPAEYEEVYPWDEEHRQWILEQEEAAFARRCAKLNAELREITNDCL